MARAHGRVAPCPTRCAWTCLTRRCSPTCWGTRRCSATCWRSDCRRSRPSCACASGDARSCTGPTRGWCAPSSASSGPSLPKSAARLSKAGCWACCERYNTSMLKGLRALADLPGLRRRVLAYRGQRSFRTEDGIDVWTMPQLHHAHRRRVRRRCAVRARSSRVRRRPRRSAFPWHSVAVMIDPGPFSAGVLLYAPSKARSHQRVAQNSDCGNQ